MKKVVFVLFLVLSLQVMGQEKHKVTTADYDNNKVEMADAMRQNGKIYVVVTVLSIILTGLFIYAFSIDKKVSRLEKEIERNA